MGFANPIERVADFVCHPFNFYFLITSMRGSFLFSSMFSLFLQSFLSVMAVSSMILLSASTSSRVNSWYIMALIHLLKLPFLPLVLKCFW